MAEPLNILFTCIGRRVALVRAFRAAAKRLKITLRVHGADSGRLAPAIFEADVRHVVPSVTAPDYIDALERIIVRRKIKLLIPLIDTELPAIAAARDRLAQRGCSAMISDRNVIDICRDKLLTYQRLTEAGIPTPATWLWADVVKRRSHRFPYFLKPRFGSAAMGNHVIDDVASLRFFGRRVPDAIVQEFIAGEEYTMDVYADARGVPQCVVPRHRLEVRGGEVSKAVIAKKKDIMRVGAKVARALKGCRGVVTVQCIKTGAGDIRVLEINPRFGGGIPLAIHAGADFPRWVLQEALGRKPKIDADGFRDDVVMLRYDDAVFVRNAAKLMAKR
ncbi:MAG: ATP-grasp domain-containing protein [Phycisphaerae bacterium]